ncbi:hypothetical protein FRC06_005815 [Ceratobasidium sp. 370]|nr:hypothetical protein FRC06_005815 [Ceratobasidium sp. 370]
MKTLGEPVSDPMLAQIMMHALPPTYAVVNTVIQTTNQNSTITPDIVFKAALAEEERRKKGQGLTAMFTQSASKSKSSGSKPSNNSKSKPRKDKGPPCTNCGKTGHTKPECWAKGGGAEGTGPQQKWHATKQAKEKSFESTSKTESAKVATASEDSPAQPSLYALPAIETQSSNAPWLLDSGASRHMTPHRHWFATYQVLTTPVQIRVGDRSRIPAIGVGRIFVSLKNRHGEESDAVIKAVLHVLSLHASLMSVNELVDGGTDVLFRKSIGAVLVADQGRGREIGFARASGNLFKVQARVTHTEATAHVAFVEPDSQNDRSDDEADDFVAYAAGTVARADLTTWHRRLGHLNYEYVLDMVRKGAARGMDIVGNRSPPKTPCEPCLKGKQTRAPFPESQNHASELLELLHSDLHGPVATQAIGGPKYFAVTIDDKSRKMFVHLLKSKDDYPANFKDLKASVENLTGKKIKHLRTDGRGECASNAFEAWMRAEGIEHQKTEANSSASNGVAERAIRTLNDCQRAMRADAGLPDKYWGYAIHHAAYLWNVTPKRFLDGRTPDEVFTGKKPDVSRLRTFGCKAWARVPDEKRTKLEARSIECTYLGFAPNRKAHILAERVTGRILTSRDVVFDEGGETRQRVIIEDFDGEGAPEDVGDAESTPKDEPEAPESAELESLPEDVNTQPEEAKPKPKTLTNAPASDSIASRCPTRTIRAPVRADDARYEVSSYKCK